MSASNTRSMLNRSGLSRRSFVAGAGGFALGAGTLGAPRLLRAQPSRMVIPNSGGALEDAYRKAYFETFTAETGVEISGAPYAGIGRVKAMVENNAVDVDTMNIDAAEAAIAAREGLLEPIDYSIVDPDNLMMPEARKEHYILADVAAHNMAWNANAFTEETRPKNWEEFFNPEAIRGQRSLWKVAAQTFEVAAMGAGQPKDALYPLDLALILATLDKIRDRVTWWDSGAQSAQLLISNEVDVGTTWNGRVFQPKRDGAPVDFTFDHCLYVYDAFIVPKGAPNPEWSMRFLANLVKPENQATFARNIPYGPVVPSAFDLLDADTISQLPNAPENSGNAVSIDVEYWAENGSELFDAFNRWLLG